MLFTVCLALRVCVLGWVMPSRHRDSLRFVACIRCSYFLDRASPAFEFACAEWTTNAHDDSALLVSTLMQSLSSHIISVLCCPELYALTIIPRRCEWLEAQTAITRVLSW